MYSALILRKLGAKSGDRIAVCLPNSPDLMDLLLACIDIGAVFCPLNIRLPHEALQEQIHRLQPKLIFSSLGFETRFSYPSNLLPSSFLLFTSGSCGTPKIASISLNSFQASAKAANVACDFKEGDAWRLSLPMHHVSGLSIVFRCLTAGAKIILDDRDFSVTHLSCVSAQLYNAWPIYRKLKCLLLGGGPIYDVPPELPCLLSYGMTETASLVLAGKTSTSLFPIRGKEIKLSVDGEILVRGDSMFQGYWDGRELDTPFDNEGWFPTKDLGVGDHKLGFTILGRKDNQFISGGENIQPEEIEQELLKLPGVLEALVGPRMHERFGMRPIAYLKLSQGSIDTLSIQHTLANRLPKVKIPDAFFLLEDQDGELKRKRKKIFNYVP